MGFPAAPVDFNVARATHKVTENALGLASGVPALGPSPYLLAGIKALEYAAFGLILFWSFMTVGLGAGVMAIGYIALIQSTAPRDHQTAVAKVIAPAPVIVAAPPVALARPKVMPAKPRAAPAAKTLSAVVLPTPVPSPIPTRIPMPVQVKLSPDQLIRRGMVSLNAGQWPSAIQSFSAARKLQPNKHVQVLR